ncbi:MAG: methyl-accepting chemotaxis protein [Desulfobacter sp.]|nr:MAG: methyl-accepting chemotaxis protein [Desulfobacter sp.]
MLKRLTIKTKLMLSVTGFVIVLMMVSGFVSNSISFNIIYDRISSKEAPASVSYIAETFEKKMDKSMAISMLIGDNPHIIQWIKGGEPKDAEPLAIEYLKKIKENDMDFVFLVSAPSKAYYTDKGIFKTVDKNNPRDSWFFSTLASGKKLSINFDVAEDTQALMAFINVLVGPTDKPLGVAGAGINLSGLSQQLSQTKLSPSSTAYMTAPDGTILAHPEKTVLTDIKNIKNFKDGGFRENIAAPLLDSEHGEIEYTDDTGVEKLVVFKTIPATGWKIVFDIPKDELGQGLEKIQIYNLAMTLGSILLLVLLLSLFINRILKPVRQTVETLEDISQGEGDLTQRISVSSEDEIGALAKAFNTFQEKLCNIISDARGYSEKVDQASEQMLGITRKVSGETESISGRTRTIADAAGDVNTSMESVASAVEEANSNLSMVAGAVEEMSATISEISKNSSNARQISEKAVAVSDETSQQIETLGVSANEIGNVTDTITDISEQTNLLALNATIEAARAGEAGKGFAVVAAEIKELAGQTTTAAQEINAKISAIQDATTDSAQKVREVGGIINDCNDIISSIAAAIEEQTATTQEISGNITQLADGIQEVSANVATSAHAVNTVNSDIESTNSSVADLAGSSADMTANAQAVADLANKLKELMGVFKI